MAPRIQPEIEGIPKEYYQDKKPAMLIAISDANNTEKDVENYVARFLEGGWSVDTADENGNTALMYAVKFRRYLTVRLLMQKGANPMIPNNEGRIPMHIAARWGLLRHMDALYGNEFRDTKQLDVQDKTGWTALMNAVVYGRIQCVTWLMMNNANAELRDAYGNGAYELIKLSPEYATRTIRVILMNKLSDEYKKAVNIPIVGIYYSIEEFRKLDILTGLRMGSRENEDCDVGEFNGGKRIPVKIDVCPGELDLEWDRRGDQLYIFCAEDLQRWLKTMVPYYNMLRSKNPFNNKQIYGVEFLTQEEIDEEVAKRNVPKTLKRKRESSQSRLEQLKANLEMAKKNKKSKDEIKLLKKTISVLESLISDSESDSDTDSDAAGVASVSSVVRVRLKF